MREFIKNILLISVPSLIILYILLEVILSFFMPLPNRPETIYDQQTDILKFSPKSGSGTHTKGKFFQITADWNINNEGWNYPQNYEQNPEKDLIAVIGDSYVEALQVDADENSSYLLRNMAPDNEVYAFGKSLYPLSQYLHVSRHVVEKYDPSTLVFTVVHNDFNESIDGQGNDLRFKSLMQLIIRPDSSVIEREPIYHEYLQERLNPGILRKLALKSRVQRYIRYPDFLGIQPKKIIPGIKNLFQTRNEKDDSWIEDNIDSGVIIEMKGQIGIAVHYVIKKIREENPDKRIIFIMDAPRSIIYSGQDLKNSGNYWIHKLMREATEKNNVEFVDLAPLMEADYRKNRTKFNSEIDSHWNEYGHQFVAETLYNHLMSE